MKPHFIIPLIATLALSLTSCAKQTVNSLQDAVDSTHDQFGSISHPGRIAEEYIKGDWAYVRTSGAGVVAHGEFVVVSTNQGRKWTVLSFALFQIDGKTLQFLQMKFGGNLAQAKEKELEKSLSEEAKKRWSDYLSSASLCVTPPRQAK